MRAIPSKKVCMRFYLTYELKGAQKGIDVLSEYYDVTRMKIIVDGRRVPRYADACYWDGTAFFKRRTINKRNVLHEFYHHLAECFEWDLSERREEGNANRFSKSIKKKK